MDRWLDGQIGGWADGQMARTPRREITFANIFLRESQEAHSETPASNPSISCCRLNHSHASSHAMAKRTLNLLICAFMNHIMNHDPGSGDRRACI